MIRAGITLVCQVLCLAALAAPATATSVAPMRLAEVGAEASVVQRARVASRQVTWGEHRGRRAIVTVLRFDRITLLKGDKPVRSVTLFGGTIQQQGEQRTMTLVGQPQLRLNEEVFLFFERDHSALPSPFVGIWRGAYPVRKGQVHNEGRPLVDFVDGYPALARDNEHGMSAAAFQSALKRALTRSETPRATTPIRTAPAVKLPTLITTTPAQTEVPIEELVGGGTDEAELADRPELPPERADELPLGFQRPSSPLSTGAVAPSAPTFAEEER